MKHRTRRELLKEAAALHMSVRHYEDIIEGLGEQIRRMTPEYYASPYCSAHGSIASRQQVKSGNYTWMAYCNYQLRRECAIEQPQEEGTS